MLRRFYWKSEEFDCLKYKNFVDSQVSHGYMYIIPHLFVMQCSVGFVVFKLI